MYLLLTIAQQKVPRRGKIINQRMDRSLNFHYRRYRKCMKIPTDNLHFNLRTDRITRESKHCFNIVPEFFRVLFSPGVKIQRNLSV